MKVKGFITLLIVLITLLVFCKGKKIAPESTHLLKSEIVNRTDSTLSIKITLLNDSNYPFPYIFMSCDSYHVYAIKSKAWVLPLIICQSNTPVQDVVAPHENFTAMIKLKLNSKYKGNDVRLKVGFKIFDSNIHALKDMPNSIIWGETLYEVK